MPKLAVVTQDAEAPPTLLDANALPDAYPVLVVPGWNGSGPTHWQTIWEEQHPKFKRVEQANWTRPARQQWIDQIQLQVRAADHPVFLVAHSLGCLAIAHWAAEASERETGRVAGAFLVAPPWLTENGHCPNELSCFSPMPLARLPFEAMLVASENDPYIPIEVGARLAAAWGAQFVNVGRQGHINVQSGHGDWPEGKGLLRGFMAEVKMLDSHQYE